MLQIKKATIEETQVAQDLLTETAKWLQEIGSTQWSDVLEGTDKHGLREAVKKQQVHFFYNEKQQLIGMAAAWKKPSEWDRRFWANHQLEDAAYYIHRIIVRPIYRGKKYGEEIIAKLKETYKNEVAELRLDCLASNDKLITFYKKNGFENIGTAKDENGEKFELFSYFFDK